MKNVFLYYILLMAPVGLIFWMYEHYALSSDMLAGMILLYLLVYKSYLDGKRLVAKKIIRPREIWIMMIPGNQIRYFRELYF